MNEKYFGSDTDIEKLKISDEDVDKVKISKLPNRPNSVSAFGGTALSAKDLKEKYDAPTQMIKDKFNALVGEINKIEGPNSAEQNRRAAEILRAEAENARAAAEIERGNAEELRNEAEDARANAEIVRVDAENTRNLAYENAETERNNKYAAAEEKRQEYYSKIEPNLRAIADIQQGFINENGEGEGGAFVSLLQAYPIGSIYMSVNATDPATLFGGEWERIKDTFLLSAGDTYGAGTSGGSADAVLIEHTHDITSYQGNPTYLKSGSDASGVLVVHDSVDYVTNGASSAHKLNARHAGKGGGQGKNMPPYLAVYVWKRVG